MGTVIGLSRFQLTRHSPASGSRRRRTEQVGFTPRDRADLERWPRAGRSVSLCASEMGSFAMLYEPGQLWASWGAVRQGDTVLLWNCVTLADVGRFRTVAEGLSHLSPDDAPVQLHNVIPFAVGKAATAAGAFGAC